MNSTVSYSKSEIAIWSINILRLISWNIARAFKCGRGDLIGFIKSLPPSTSD